MASQTAIVNLALGKLGAETTLSNLDENIKAARTAKAVWDIARDAALAEHPWNFAIKRLVLQPLVSAPAWGYQLQFQAPTDMIRLIEVNEAYVWNIAPGEAPPYQLEGDRILTDLGAPLKVRYVWRITDTVKYSAKFVDALAWKLAHEMALPITESATTWELMEKGFADAIAKAKHIDGTENPPEIPVEDDWIDAREMS